ncbi:DUF397 domain-containing protein [Streptomyces abikoensis]|uniref:DUF397 domain-containing protein n=1 Tax=Streptomyces abikoensis TaxID=97398 RepID=UPI0037154FCE
MSTTPDSAPAIWVKSSYSGNGGDTCVEWSPSAAATTGAVPVRDSKDPAGPTLRFSPAAWTSFVTDVKRTDEGAM